MQAQAGGQTMQTSSMSTGAPVHQQSQPEFKQENYQNKMSPQAAAGKAAHKSRTELARESPIQNLIKPGAPSTEVKDRSKSGPKANAGYDSYDAEGGQGGQAFQKDSGTQSHQNDKDSCAKSSMGQSANSMYGSKTAQQKNRPDTGNLGMEEGAKDKTKSNQMFTGSSSTSKNPPNLSGSQQQKQDTEMSGLDDSQNKSSAPKLTKERPSSDAASAAARPQGLKGLEHPSTPKESGKVPSKSGTNSMSCTEQKVKDKQKGKV